MSTSASAAAEFSPVISEALLTTTIWPRYDNSTTYVTIVSLGWWTGTA